MSKYHSSTPKADWSNCKQCRLHSTRRNVVVRRSGFIYNSTITPLRIDTTPFNQEQRHVVRRILTNSSSTTSPTAVHATQSVPSTTPTHSHSVSHVSTPTTPTASSPATSPATSQSNPDRHVTQNLLTPTEGNRPFVRDPQNSTRHESSNDPHHSVNGSRLSVPFVLFIGEAPGESEDLLGEPFCGPSYQPLTRIQKECSRVPPHLLAPIQPPSYPILSTINQPYNLSLLQNLPALQEVCLSLSFFFTVTNVVCCRPSHTTDTTNDHSQLGKNRQPTQAESLLCQPHLIELLSSYNYTHVVSLGQIANDNYMALSNRLQIHLPHLHIKHPAWFLRQDYLLLLIIEAGKQLRDFLNQC